VDYVGKGTIVEGLMKHFSSSTTNMFGFCVSHTTRQPRPGERHGQHYYFIDIEEMQEQIDQDQFVEYAHVHGNIYGTSKQAIQKLQNENKITILDIDMQGVISVKESGLVAKYVFITPPSIAELENRLRGRNTETEDAIKRRLNNAAKEIGYGNTVGNFDYVFVNDEIDTTVSEMIHVLKEWYPQLN
jgi:guanylate kinase